MLIFYTNREIPLFTGGLIAGKLISEGFLRDYAENLTLKLDRKGPAGSSIRPPARAPRQAIRVSEAVGGVFENGDELVYLS